MISVGSFFFPSFYTEVLYEGMQFKDSLEMDQPGGTWAETCSTTSTQSVDSAAVPVSSNSTNPFNLSKKAFFFFFFLQKCLFHCLQDMGKRSVSV